MAVITERAPAKINLTLEVRGRRPDGYHELLSLVAFADVADTVTLDTECPADVRVSGPFAAEIAGPNLLDTALALLRERAPNLVLGAVNLEKRLPVAAGIGGGSADAAALLRAAARANPELRDQIDWRGLAVRLGADVAVCLENRASWMSGAGEVVEPLASPLSALNAVLVNPRVRVPADKTAQVFQKFAALPYPDSVHPAKAEKRAYGSRGELVAFLAAKGNDLEPAAIAVVPALVRVMAALNRLPQIELARLSGAGPTCYGIFPTAPAAEAAAVSLRNAQPEWWVEATVIT